MTILVSPQSQNPYSGGHEIHTFGRGPPGLHNLEIIVFLKDVGK